MSGIKQSWRAHGTISRASAFLAILLAFLVAALITAPADAPAQTPDVPGERTGVTISAEGSKEPVTIALDRIGIVTLPGVDERRLDGVARALQGKLLQSFEGGIYVFGLPEQRPRKEVVAQARRIRQEFEVVRQAGLVLYPEGFDTPLIASDELIVQFRKGAGREVVEDFARRFDLTPVMNVPLIPEQWLFRVEERSGRDVLQSAELVRSEPAVAFAHPNLIAVVVYRQFTPNDPLFANQWHHSNTGQAGGTVDADVDTDFAWTLNQGNAAITIAVLDSGFDIAHEDIQPNLWTNPGEVAGNGADDENNGFVDDINGYSFIGCTAITGPNCGSGNIGAANHGTSVAGVTAARGNNALGVSGACPNCTVIPIQQGAGFFADALAISYPGVVGARIMTNSWGYAPGTAVPANVSAAIAATAGTGTVIFWAMNNINRNDCTGAAPDISADPNVIAVSAASNQDRKVTESAFGNCMELLSPTHRGYGPNPNGFPAGSGVAYSGTLNVASTDRTGNAGYNNNAPQNAANGFDPTFCPAETGNRNYTLCFGGTSSATPLAAGVGGLVLSANAGLTPLQVQRILQDTADKTEDSLGSYAEATGFSTPTGGGAATHGYGRINAFEAVRLAAPSAAGGRGGVDVFIRDNRLDWGNTEQPSNVLMEPARGFIPHYVSVDIKVDSPAGTPGFQPAPTTSAQFDAFTHEDPISGALNRVYVRVHNRGPQPAADVLVKLHWAFAGTALPALPNDFWTAWPGDSTDPTSRWTSLGSQTVPALTYSGASVGGSAADASQILGFDFMGPPLDPALPAFRHHCLFVVIDSPDDPVSAQSQASLVPDQITPTDNNVTHRNISLQDPSRDGRLVAGLYVRNPFRDAIVTRLNVIQPKGWKVSLGKYADGRPFELKAGAEEPVEIKVALPSLGAAGSVEIRQEVLREKRFEPIGGFVYRFAPESEGRRPPAEDCIAYDPDKLTVVEAGDAWVLTDGAMKLLLLDSKADAEKALELGRRHGFQCFIGRDNNRPNRKDFIVQYWK